MLPGAVANPTPGTIVVHFNGKVQVDAGACGPAPITVDRDVRRARSRADHQHRQRAIGPRPQRRRHGADFHPWRERHRHGEAATAVH